MDGQLHGRRLLVTAGPTWMPVDAIRHLSNFATGSLGLFLARRAATAGAQVVLLLGPGRALASEADRAAIRVVDFVTFDDLHGLVREQVGSRRFQAMIHTAAVADYRPASVSSDKTPSGQAEWTLRLVPTPKIVDEVRSLDPEILLVKFKLEVGRTREELVRIGAESRARSDADLLVANDRATFTPGRHPALLLDRTGVIAATETREQLSETLLGEIGRRLA